jgi:hypothetical protein
MGSTPNTLQPVEIVLGNLIEVKVNNLKAPLWGLFLC